MKVFLSWWDQDKSWRIGWSEPYFNIAAESQEQGSQPLNNAFPQLDFLKSMSYYHHKNLCSSLHLLYYIFWNILRVSELVIKGYHIIFIKFYLLLPLYIYLKNRFSPKLEKIYLCKSYWIFHQNQFTTL